MSEGPGGGRSTMSDYDDDFMADDEDYDLEYSEDSNSGKMLSQRHPFFRYCKFV